MGAGGVALVGASESMPWTYWLIRNLVDHGYAGSVWPVNPRQSSVHGRPAFADLAALPEVPDTAVCLLRPDLAESTVDELVTLGTSTIVVVSNGFRETGDPAAAEREARIAKRCQAAGVRLIGPNCVGYADFGDAKVVIAEPVPVGLARGRVSVASQSGALLSGVLGAVAAGGAGLRRAYSLGNGAAFGITEAIEEFADDDASMLVLVVEAVTEPERFAAAVQRCRAAGKTVLALRLGRSARAAAVARSHTGAVVGADRLMGAWLERLGVVAVDAIEELPILVRLLDEGRRAPGSAGGVFVLTGSGGAAGYAADLASRAGVELAELSPATIDALREAMPAGVFIGNPLDLTGADARRKKLVRDLVYADPAVGVVVEPYSLPWPDEAEDRHWFRDGLLGLAESSVQHGMPTLTASVFGEPLTPWVTWLGQTSPIVTGPSFLAAMTAAARVFPNRPATTTEHGTDGAAEASSWVPDRAVVAEAEARDLLAGLGVPLVPGSVFADPASAAAYAARLGRPVAVKAAVEGLAHKGRVGGVRLDVLPADVASVCEQMRDAVAASGVDAPVRFLVQRMVRGPELLIGLVRDPVAGASVTVGVGGWAVELVAPLCTLSLSTLDETLDVVLARQGSAALRDLFARHGLARALGPDRTAEFAAITADLVGHFVDGALRDYSTLEINPVVLTPEGPFVADALLVR